MNSADELLDYNSQILEVVNYFKCKVKEIGLDTSDNSLDDILLSLSEESGLSDLMIEHLDEILDSCSDKKITFFNRFANVIVGLEEVSERKIKAALYKLKSNDSGFIELGECLTSDEIKNINLYGACVQLKEAVREIKKAKILKTVYFFGVFLLAFVWGYALSHNWTFYFGLEIASFAWALLAPIMEPHYAYKRSLRTFFNMVNLTRLVMLVISSAMIVSMNYLLYASIPCGILSLVLIYFLYIAYMHDFRKAN